MAAPSYTKVENTSNVPLTPLSPQRSKYHPHFASPEGDVVLRSLEGTLYRLHSYTLRSASGLFSTLFTLPQPTKYAVSKEPCMPFDIAPEIDVYELDFVLERLLRMLCGLPIEPWLSYDDVERVLAVAEKWDAPGPISTIRNALTSPLFLTSDPLRLYALSRHFEWKEEAKLAATQTLTLNLHDPKHALRLAQMSSRDLMPLLNLHRKRRDMFKQLLDSPERFTAGNSSPYHCTRCGVTQLDNHTWRELKHAMFLEIDRRPLGDNLGAMVGEMAEWPEAKACWEARCKKEDCGGYNYDRMATLRQIRNCIDTLPITIDN